MICPKCSNDDTKVIDSRMADEGTSIRRRRECVSCGFRYTTFERVETIDLKVQKKDEVFENYSREKAIRGIMRACEKRPVSNEAINNMLNELERDWIAYGREIPSNVIGHSIMAKLKEIDDVAYIRFASVYRRFQDIESFKKELNKLLKD